MGGLYGSGVYGGSIYGGEITVVSGTGITVTANPLSSPPRFEIEIATPSGAAMTAVVLNRTVSGITTQTRVQPLAGLSYRYIEDYEAPWYENVVYSATVTTTSGIDTYVAPPIQLQPWSAWAIHPTVPSLSVCIDRLDPEKVGVAAIQTVARASTVTQHAILGAARPIVTKTGPRASSRGALQINTLTSADEAAMWVLVDDQTPLLIQFPTPWDANWEPGYYDIGDVSADRAWQYVEDTRRLFILPFTRVDAPAGQQQSTWTYSQLLADFTSYGAVIAGYNSYAALVADDRN
jgi:hypothetical protein